MGLFSRNKNTFGAEREAAGNIAKRSLDTSHQQFRGEVGILDDKYPHVAGVPSHPQYKDYWNEYNAAYSRMGDRNREINQAAGQTAGTLQMKHFPDAVRSGRVWSPDPALDNFGNRNLSPGQFGGGG